MIVAPLEPSMKATRASHVWSHASSAPTSVEPGAQSAILIRSGLIWTETHALTPVASVSTDLQQKPPLSVKPAITLALHAMELLTPAKAATLETLRSIITP
jgi:hypothetical protein